MIDGLTRIKVILVEKTSKELSEINYGEEIKP